VQGEGEGNVVCHQVILPRELRLACLLSGFNKLFSGTVRVISSNVETVIPRRPGEVGL
jgi:hypothetical protein